MEYGLAERIDYLGEYAGGQTAVFAGHIEEITETGYKVVRAKSPQGNPGVRTVDVVPREDVLGKLTVHEN